MFSLFKNNTNGSYPDKVWKTRAMAWKQVATEALRDITDAEIPVVIFFFKDDHDQFDAFLVSLKVPLFRIDLNQHPVWGEKKVFTMNAFSLDSMSIADLLSRQSKNSRLNFIFFGHYPLPDREHAILEKISSVIGPEVSVVFHNSLEDPLMRTFGSEKLAPLLETLGLKDDECIEHALVSKSLNRIREKIAANVKTETEASSEAGWFDKNLK